MATNYYQVLGVQRDATSEEIKRAFRQLARETHPDANPGDPETEARFRQAAEAYEVLSNPERRRRYDRGDTIDLGDLLSGFGGIEDLLRSVFADGGLFGGREPRPSRGRDILVYSEITLEQAATGSDVSVDFRSRVSCSSCSGSGASPGTGRSTCSECGGSGQVRVTQRSFLGTVLTAQTCGRCSGSGYTIERPCQECSGVGAVTEDVGVKVEIPPGVTSGTRLRLTGRGEAPGAGGIAGDLYVEIAVADHPLYERDGNDLWYALSVGIAEASLGTVVSIPVIEGGEVELEVPAGTQPGDTFRISGAGMPALGRKVRGELIVVVGVRIPTGLSAEEEELMRRWADLRGERTDRPASAL